MLSHQSLELPLEANPAATIESGVARVDPAAQEIHPHPATVDVGIGLQFQAQLVDEELADLIPGYP